MMSVAKQTDAPLSNFRKIKTSGDIVFGSVVKQEDTDSRTPRWVGVVVYSKDNPKTLGEIRSWEIQGSHSVDQCTNTWYGEITIFS